MGKRVILAEPGGDEGWIENLPTPETGTGERSESPQDGTEETLEAGTEVSQQQIPVWPWLLGGSLLAVLAALLLWRFLRIRKKKECGNSGETVRVSNVGNLHHIGSRREQQDSFAISDISDRECVTEKGVFAVVADGMGGLRDGGQISAIVTSVMLGIFENSGPVRRNQIPGILLSMVQEANRRVIGFLKEGREQGGSTVTAVWIFEGKLYLAAVGDSRICLIRSGTLTVLNREHVYGSQLDEMAARGEISAQEARNDPQRHALTSYIGMDPLEKIDRSVHGFALLPGDRILLMSDGVFGTLTEEEILNAAENDAQAMAEELQGQILTRRKPGQDNFTAVILQCR